MTAVVFKFVHPDGTPVVDTPFVVSLRKTSFDEKLDVGILLPGDVQGLTDADGSDTLELMAGFGTYYLTMTEVGASTDSEGCVGGLRYRFVVPESDTPVRIEDIIVTTPTFSRPWDEVALQIIIDAKISSQQSADAAQLSEVAAGEYAVRAEAAVESTETNAEQAAQSAAAAGQSAATAGDASTAAIQARNEAEGFRDQARTSEMAAGNSATTATQQAGLASQEKIKAQEYAEQAEFSAGDAEVARVASVAASEASAGSADAAAASAVTTGQDKQATAADRLAVTGLKTEVTGLKDETKGYRDEALAAVGTITGAFVDGGLVDLSGGAYPTKPDVSTIWKVQIGGTVTTVKEGTIVYAAGDGLVYTKTQDTWYKNDSQSAVTKVNGKQGDVVLTKADIGLPLADNTADVDKPISNAVQAALDIRVPTSSRTDTTAGRLVKVGDFGENGGAAILKSASDDANAITVPGTYVFNGGGLNLPENTVYIKHFNHSVAGYSKQIAYGLQTNKVFVRTLNNTVWTDWGPAVDIVDSLTSADPAKALSARQGKILLELLQANNATLIRYTFNVAAGQTTITGNSLEGVPLSYVPGVPFMVEKDGFPIWLGNDYTASNGSSITLTKASTVASQIAITVFGAFSVADHYTKAEADVLRIAHQVGSDYISGLVVTCENGTNLSVTSGFAFIPGENKVVDVPSALTIALSGLPVGQWYSLYLYLNAGVPAIELVATAPSDPYRGTARTKLADTSRRLLGMFRTNTSGGLWPFYADSSLNLRYIVDFGTAGFRVLNNGFSTVKAVVDVSNVIPVISRVCNCTLTSGNTAAATVASIMPNGAPLTVAGGLQTIGSGKFPESFITDATQKLQYVWNTAPNGGLYIDVTGFRFER